MKIKGLRPLRSLLSQMIRLSLLPLLFILTACQKTMPSYHDLTEKKILFLGDSITHNGHYADLIETSLLLHGQEGEILNLGLSSETVSGLSEEDHPFPRPYLHTRLKKVLEAVKPDVVIACYGMNCGIYHPFSEERFQKYQEGILSIIVEAKEIGAETIILTPPPYASAVKPRPHNPSLPYGFKNPTPEYNEVLQKYADWINTHEEIVSIDLRPTMEPHLAESYLREPVHPNPTGHSYMACAVLKSLGIEPDFTSASFIELLRVVKQQRTSYDLSLLNHLGHGNPNVLKSKRLEIQDAEEKNKEYQEKIEQVLRREFE